MRKIHFLFLLSLFFITKISGQNTSTLEKDIEELSQSIKYVVTKSITYEQSITWDAETPHKLTFKQDKVGKKKTESMSYELSFKDIDVNTIRVKNKKDLMTVSIFINNSQKLIKVFKDGEQEKYIDELAIMALDIDNGRAIEKILKKIIKLTKNIKSSCDPENFDDRINWLSGNIETFKINETTFEQSFNQTKKSSSIVTYKIVERGKKTKEEIWKFNLADLSPRKIKMQVKDKDIFVEVQTKRNFKYIYYEKDGEQENYTNKLKFFMADFDQARCMLSILEKIIKDSEVLDAAIYVKPTSLTQSLNLLEANVINIQDKNIELPQSIKASCITQLTTSQRKSKGETIEEIFNFNLSDIQAKSIKIKVKSKGIIIELNTSKTKLIQPVKNGEIQNYSNKLTITANGIENAKMLAFIFPEAIAFCKKEATFKPAENVSDNLKWISEQLSKVNEAGEIDQSMKNMDDNNSKWQFTVIEAGKKQDKEEIYEFNLEDLDEKAIEFKISGKELSIEINTRHHEKIIKYYKNGEPENYKDSFLIRLQDLEDARNMIRVFEKAIKTSKK